MVWEIWRWERGGRIFVVVDKKIFLCNCVPFSGILMKRMICICMYSLFVRFCLFYCSETIQFHSIFCWFYFCTVLGIPCLALFSYISSYFIFPIYIDLDTRFLLLLVHIISVSPSPFPMPLLSSLSPPSPLSLSLPLCASSPIYPISLSTPLSLSPPHLPHLSTPSLHCLPISLKMDEQSRRNVSTVAV